MDSAKAGVLRKLAVVDHQSCHLRRVLEAFLGTPGRKEYLGGAGQATDPLPILRNQSAGRKAELLPYKARALAEMSGLVKRACHVGWERQDSSAVWEKKTGSCPTLLPKCIPDGSEMQTLKTKP